MKILQYIPTASFFLGGGEVVPINQAIFLSKLGHKVTIVIAKSKHRDTLLKDYRLEEFENIQVVEFEVKGDFEKYVNSLESTHREFQLIYLYLSRDLSEYLSKNQFDWIITHYPPANFGIHKDQKILHLLHGVPPNWDVICDSALRIADNIIAVSNSVAQGWHEKFNFTGGIEVLQNGIDTSFFKPKNLERKNLLFVGRLIEIKGLQYLLPAMREVVDIVGQEIILNIVGIGPFRDEVERLIVENKLEKNIILLGNVSKSQLLNLYQTSQISIFPSFEREGVLTTMLESASSGCPIITCNCCGMIDFAKHEVNSLLCEPKSVIDIRDNIVRLIKDKSLRDKISTNALEEIVENWSWEKYTERLINLIS